MKRVIAAVTALALLAAVAGDPGWAQRVSASRPAAAPLTTAGQAGAAPAQVAFGIEQPVLSLEASGLDAAGVAPSNAAAAALPAIAPAALLSAPAAPLAGPATSALPAQKEAEPPPGPEAARKEITAIAREAAPALEAVSEPQASGAELHALGGRLERILLGQPDPRKPELPRGDAAPAVRRPGLGPSRRLAARPADGRGTGWRRPAPRESPLPAALGAALPLSLWPALFIGLAILTIGSALLAADTLMGRRLSRWAAWAFRPGPSPERVERNLRGLFGLREADVKPVSEFLAAWTRAEAKDLRGLLASARRHGELALPLLLAAYLSGNSQAGSELLLAEIASLRATRLHPDDALRHLLESRSAFAWLAHPRASRLLAALESSSEPSQERFGALGRAVLLIPLVLFGLTGAAAFQSWRYGGLQEAAAREARDTFWGEHAYVFRSDYRDDATGLIKTKVLPAFEGWNRPDAAQQARWLESVRILRSLATPRADNLLQALFERADALGLAPGTENELLVTLMERDSPQLWRYVEEYMAAQGSRPGAAERLLRMIEIGAALGASNENVFLNMFHFLKSPHPQVSRRAAEKISASLNEPARAAEFLSRLSAASDRHADPELQLRIETFLLERLSGPLSRDLETGPAEALFTRILDRASGADKPARLKALSGLQPGENQVSLPVPRLERGLAYLEARLDQSRSGGRPPDALAVAAQAQVHRLAKALIVEARDLSPDLRSRLRAAGLLTGFWDPEIDPLIQHLRPLPPHGGITGGVWAPGMSLPPGLYPGQPAIRIGPPMGPMSFPWQLPPPQSGFSGGVWVPGAVMIGPWGHPMMAPPDRSLRDTYTLKDLRALRSLLSEALKKPGLTVTQFEYLDRARREARRLLAVAQKAGILEGGTPEEETAAELNAILHDGLTRFNARKGFWLQRELRRHGLIYDAEFTAFDKDRMYRPGHDAASTEEARLALAGLLARGEAAGDDGKPRPMSWAEKRYLAGALERVEALQGKRFPGPRGERPAGSAAAAARFAALREALRSRDPKAIDRAEAGLAEALRSAWSPDLFLAQLADAQGRFGDDAELQLWILRFLPRQLAGPGSARLDAEGAEELLELAFNAAGARRLEAWSALLDAPARPPVAAAIRFLFEQHAPRLVNEALERDPLRAARLLELGVLRRKTSFGYPNNPDSAKDWSGGAVRELYGTTHLRRLRAELRRVDAKDALLPVLDAMLAAGAKAGVPERGEPGEAAADELNYLLRAGDEPFGALTFLEALRKEGVVPPGEFGTLNYPSTYSAQDLRRLHRFLARLLDGGMGWDFANQPQPLSALQARFLADAMEFTDQLMERFYPGQALSPPTLGRLLAGSGTRKDAVDRLLEGTPDPQAFLARLAAARARHPSNAGIHRELARRLLARLGSPRARTLEGLHEAHELWQALFPVRPDDAPWSLLEKALDAPTPELRSFVLEQINAEVLRILGWAETGRVEVFRARMRQEGVMRPDGFRRYYSQRHLRLLAAAILEDGQGASFDRDFARQAARELIPRLVALGARAGMLPGDTPGERAAEEVNPVLFELHKSFGGNTAIPHGGFVSAPHYVEALRAAGLAPKLPASRSYWIDPEFSFSRAYSPQALRDLAAFHKRILDGGTGWNFLGPNALTEPQKGLLRRLIGTLERLAKD